MSSAIGCATGLPSRLGEDNYEILPAANAERWLAQRRPITCDLAGFDHSF
jgi:hypothetical protein